MRLVLAALLLIACSGSGANEPKVRPQVVRDAETCAKAHGSCFMVHVKNDQSFRAVVRLNGVKLGEVEGYSQDSFPVPDTQLKNGRCANVSVRLIGIGLAGSSDQQCLRPGGYFAFQIDNLGNLWLTPWGGR